MAIVVVAVVPKELTEVLLRRVVLGGRVSVLGVTASTVKLIVMAGDVIVEVVAGDLHVRTELVVVVVVTVVVDVVFVINVVSLISVASSCVILSNTCSRSGHRPFLIFFHAKSKRSLLHFFIISSELCPGHEQVCIPCPILIFSSLAER